MGFLATQPGALMEAATQLEAANTAMAAQNVAATATISDISPAATDEVSILQATQFSAYGRLYEHISARAMMIQEALVRALRHNAESYQDTEEANAAKNAAQSTTAKKLTTLGNNAYQSGTATINQVGDFGSAPSDLIQLGTLANPPGKAAAAASSYTSANAPTTLVSATQPSSEPLPSSLISSGPEAKSLEREILGPTQMGSPAQSGRLVHTTQPLTSLSPTSPPTNSEAVPAAMPTAAVDDHDHYGGFGRPRYGVKPKVAPRSMVN